jgi:hypothetical protein
MKFGKKMQLRSILKLGNGEHGVLKGQPWAIVVYNIQR